MACPWFVGKPCAWLLGQLEKFLHTQKCSGRYTYGNFGKTPTQNGGTKFDKPKL